jgi:hypothetical protein
MSDARGRTVRAWRVTGVHGIGTYMRLARAEEGRILPAPGEEIAVVEVGTWRAVWTAIRAALGREVGR